MRLGLVSAILCSSFFRLCGSENPAPPSVAPPSMPGQPGAQMPMPPAQSAPTALPIPAPAPSPATAPVSTLAKFGGTIVPVGTRTVELIPQNDGRLAAYVNDPSGNLAMDGAATVSVRLAGAAQPITLTWEAPELRYVAQVSDVALTAGPAEVTVVQNGQTETGTAPVVAVVPPPERGGVVLAIGDKSAEVLAKADGTVLAYVSGPGGAVDPALTVVANVQGSDGGRHQVALAWDANQNCYVGRAPESVQVAMGPVDVSITSAGAAPVQGRIEALAILPAAPTTTGASLLAAGSYGVELVPGARAGEVQAVVSDSSGIVEGTPDTELKVNVYVSPTVVRPVTLAWNPVRRRWVGRAVGVSVSSGPVEVVFVRQGRRVRGRVARLWAPPPASVGVVVSTPAAPAPVVIPPPPVVRAAPIPPPPVVRVAPPPPPARPGISVEVRTPGVRVAPPPPARPGVSVEIRTPGVRVAPPPPARGANPPPPPARPRAPAPPARGGIRVEGGIRIGN